MATQRDWLKPNQSKQYCANEIAKMVTMGSRAQYVTYRAFTVGSEKSPFTRGEVLRGTFTNKLDTALYSAKTVKKTATFATTDTAITLKWTPVLDATCTLTIDTTTYVDIGGGKFYPTTDIESVEEVIDSNGFIKREYTLKASASQAAIVLKPGTTNDANFDSTKMTADTNKIYGSLTGTVITTAAAAQKTYTVEYQYNNEYVPQNDIPLVNLVQRGITLEAQERQIGIYYNLFAEFEAKNDYSISLGDDLADQAKFELAYDVDVDVLKHELEAATTTVKDADGYDVNNTDALTTWYAGMRVGVSQRDHYASIYDKVLEASAKFFLRTNKYEPTFILVHPLDRRFFVYCPEWKSKAQRFGVGPFVAGEIDGKTVICSPIVPKGTVVLGTNTPDVFACIYGTYMPIIQSQLLGYADGGMSQGFARMDAIKIVNPYLLAHMNISEAVGDDRVTVANTTTAPVYTSEVN